MFGILLIFPSRDFSDSISVSLGCLDDLSEQIIVGKSTKEKTKLVNFILNIQKD